MCNITCYLVHFNLSRNQLRGGRIQLGTMLLLVFELSISTKIIAVPSATIPIHILFAPYHVKLSHTYRIMCLCNKEDAFLEKYELLIFHSHNTHRSQVPTATLKWEINNSVPRTLLVNVRNQNHNLFNWF